MPAPKKTPEDLYTQKLPGGATAKWYRYSELTPKRSRPFQILYAHLAPKLRAAQRAQNIYIDGNLADTSPELAGMDLELTRTDTEALFELSDLAVVTFLKSWTLRRTVRDENGSRQEQMPVPTTADELLELPIPQPIYQALIDRANKIVRTEDSGFTVDSVEDPDSPTGDSAP